MGGSNVEFDDLEDGEYPHGTLEVCDDNLNDVVRSYDTVVVDCWAPWCGPCKQLMPMIDQMADELQGAVVFGKLNTADNKQTPDQFMVQSIPTLLIFKNGVYKDKITGLVDRSTIIRKLNSV